MGLFDGVKSLLGSKPSQANSTAPTVQPTYSQKKVLIVEDDALLANALEMKFQHEGFTVFKAANGQIGLEMIQANKPDIILLDLQMPVMDGKTMLKKLREIPEFGGLPVIVLTNAGDVDNIRETRTYYNATEFLIKSNVTPDDIVLAARKAM